MRNQESVRFRVKYKELNDSAKESANKRTGEKMGKEMDGRKDGVVVGRNELSEGKTFTAPSDPVLISQSVTPPDQSNQTANAVLEEKQPNSSSKPSLSFIALIAKGILSSSSQKLNLSSIYSYIEKHFPYFKKRHQGWRNSVRHNLSLNDCFVKLDRCEDGKGHYWGIHPAHMADFLQGDFRQHRKANRRRQRRALHSVSGACRCKEQFCPLEYWSGGAFDGRWVQRYFPCEMMHPWTSSLEKAAEWLYCPYPMCSNGVQRSRFPKVPLCEADGGYSLFNCHV